MNAERHTQHPATALIWEWLEQQPAEKREHIEPLLRDLDRDLHVMDADRPAGGAS